MSDKKVTIIGAGLGGLVTGAILAKEGLQVTVVEKNPKVGGGLQSYQRFGVTFDTGMHVFGGMYPGGNIRRICDYLGITGDFEIQNLDATNQADIYVAEENRTYSVNMKKESFVDSFARYFPHQTDNLRQYLAAIDGIMQSLDLFYLRPLGKSGNRTADDFITPADEFIAKHIDDRRLLSLLAVVNLLYAGEAGVTPAFLHSAISTIFLNGACRVVGGYSTFADALVNCIVAHGGKVVVGAPVTQIVTDGCRVKAVVTGGEQMDSDLVVSAIPPKSMIDMLDNKRLVSNAYRKLISEKKDSLSAFIINIKVKPRSVRYSNRMGFFLRSYDSAWKAYDGGSVEKFMYMTPPASCQGEYAETLNIVLPMHWEVVERWENTTVGRRGEDYAAFKAALYEAVMDEMEKAAPGIRSAVDSVDTATPLTIRDYTGVGHGAMCGERKDSNSILQFMPVVTRVPNLYLTGQSVFMHGFCGVSLTAIQTCEAILGEGYVIDRINSQNSKL